jgi:hypothetical protein
MNILQLVNDKIRGLINISPTVEPTTRDSITEHLELCINQHQLFIDTVAALSSEQRAQLTTLMEDQLRQGQHNSPWLPSYKQLLSLVPQRIKEIEQKSVFEAFVICNKMSIDMLTRLDDKIDEIFPETAVGIQNLNISQTMVFGFLDLSEMYSNCSIAFWNGILETLMHMTPNPAKYLIDRVRDNLQDVAKFMITCMTTGDVLSFDKMMERFKRENKDAYLINADNTPNTLFMKTGSADPGANSFFIHGLMTLNPLVWISQLWVLRRNARIRKIEDEREWLNAKTEAFKLQLQGVSPDSPEYRRLAGIVQKYDAIIARHEQDIERYRKGK